MALQKILEALVFNGGGTPRPWDEQLRVPKGNPATVDPLRVPSMPGQPMGAPRIAPVGVKPPFAGMDPNTTHSPVPNMPLRPQGASAELKGNTLSNLGGLLGGLVAGNEPMVPNATGDLLSPMMPGTPVRPKPMAPKLNNSGSQAKMQEAISLLAKANSEALPQAGKGPNIEAIAMALLPALFGAGNEYIGKLGHGYMAGQEQELARRNAEREQRIQQAKINATGLQTQAGSMQDAENATFNQESQTYRNEQDNERMREAQANMDARAAASLNNQKNLRYIGEMGKQIASRYGDADGWTQEDDAYIRGEIATLAEAIGEDADVLSSILISHKVGDKSVPLLGAENRQGNADRTYVQKQQDQEYDQAKGMLDLWVKGRIAQGGFNNADLEEFKRFDAALPDHLKGRFLPPVPGETVQMYTSRLGANERNRHNKVMEGQGERRLDQGDTRLTIDAFGKETGRMNATKPKASAETTRALNQSRTIKNTAEINLKAAQAKRDASIDPDEQAKLDQDIVGLKATILGATQMIERYESENQAAGATFTPSMPNLGAVIGNSTKSIKNWGDNFKSQFPGSKVEQMGPGSIPGSLHKRGLALDLKAPGDNPAELKKYVQAAMSQGVPYIIYDRVAYRKQADGTYSKSKYNGPHDHKDHVHIDWKGSGAVTNPPKSKPVQEPPSSMRSPKSTLPANPPPGGKPTATTATKKPPVVKSVTMSDGSKATPRAKK